MKSVSCTITLRHDANLSCDIDLTLDDQGRRTWTRINSSQRRLNLGQACFGNRCRSRMRNRLEAASYSRSRPESSAELPPLSAGTARLGQDQALVRLGPSARFC